MDRTKLDQWLKEPKQTWRWTTDGRSGYQAVEVKPDGLYWYTWSHETDGGGPLDTHMQTYDDFTANGPHRDMPDDMHHELTCVISIVVNHESGSANHA